MKATDLLKKQHRKVKATFRKLEKGGGDVTALVDELSNDLAAHMAIEQEIFYPAIKFVDEDMVFESFEEHALAEMALKRLRATDHSDPSFAARVTATKELIEHHVKEEEEDLFPKCERKLGEEKLSELGASMKARFDAVVAMGFEAAVPKGPARTSSDATIAKTKAQRAPKAGTKKKAKSSSKKKAA